MIPTKPMTSTWTDEQWQAIHQTGTNIIVSAGAGSGKTAVLTERIVEKLKKGTSITSLVVLTFTNAAAFEMKTRVREKLEKEIENGNTMLQESLELLDQAYITTFDSFSLSLVKKYHYLLKLPKNIKIIDNVVLTRLKQEKIEEAFAFFYQKKDKNFLQLLKTFVVKDDDKLKDICIKLNDSLESIAHKKEYLENYKNIFFKKEFIEEKIKEYTQIIANYKDEAIALYEELENIALHEVSKEFISSVKCNISPLIEAKTYDDYCLFAKGYKAISFTRSKKPDALELEKLKEAYASLKDMIDKILDLCTYESSEELYNSVEKTKPFVEALINIILKLDDLLLEEKRKLKAFTFSDITRLAIHLLENNEEIKENIKANIEEIMIDEYQDTNDIGDYFIALISHKNVYMVGDVKQSIYRFRNANPSIFKEKYNTYNNKSVGIKIDLNKNFRSRREVLDDINFLFSQIMDEEIGGANYNEGHAFIFGNKVYEEKGANQNNNHLEILDYAYKESSIKKEYKTEEIEAFIIANDIKNKISNNYEVYDKGLKENRRAKYQDFSIIIDRKTSFDLYKKIFTYLEIPLNVFKEEPFSCSEEIYVITNILKWIYSLKDFSYAKKHLKYAILSVTRSFIFQLDDEEIFNLFKDHEQDLFKYIDDASCPIKDIQQKMIDLKVYTANHTLSEILDKVYETFDIYNKILSLQNIEFIKIKLDYLLDVARNLEEMGYSIYTFIEYLEKTQEKDIDIAFKINSKDNANAVSIMSIHNSKGLEFPICYFSGLQKEFSKEDLKDNFLFSSKLGIICPIFDEGKRETFYKELLKIDYNKEDISERLRVFYVALTRAKEKMIFVTNLSDYEKRSKKNANGLIDKSARLKYKSFLDVLLSMKKGLTPYSRKLELEKIGLTKAYEQIKDTNYKDTLKESTLKIKYKDIAIKGQIEEKKHFSKSLHTFDETEANLLHFGIRMHTFLEYINFGEEKALDVLEASNYEKEKIRAFLHQPFMSNLKNAQYYPEYEIFYKEDNIDYKGIIDLLIILENEILIIDYKLKNIDKSSYEEQVLGYKKIIEKKSDKKITCILYSILDETYKIVA